jgi:glycosyltransferase involved in cell wall biosynthesis
MNSFITVTWNHIGYIKNWYNTLKKYKPEGDYEIVVFDNASTDGTIAYLKTLGDVKLILNDKNEGEGKGFNVAMKEAKGEYIYKSDPDVHFNGPFHNYMIRFFEDPEVGVVLGHNPGWEERKRDGKDYEEVYLVAGAFFCLNRKTIETVGYWESTLPYSGAELDYTARCRMKGVRIVRAFVPDDVSSNIIHSGRFQFADKVLIPKEFGTIQEAAWLKLWKEGLGTAQWYMLKGWLVEGDLYKLEDTRNLVLKVYNIDLHKGEGYLGNWGR